LGKHFISGNPGGYPEQLYKSVGLKYFKRTLPLVQLVNPCSKPNQSATECR